MILYYNNIINRRNHGSQCHTSFLPSTSPLHFIYRSEKTWHIVLLRMDKKVSIHMYMHSIHEVDQFQVIEQTTPHLVIDKRKNSTIFSITQPSTYPLRWGLSNNNLVLLARSLETLFQLSLFLSIHFLYFRLYRCIALTENGLTLAFSTLSLLITNITIAALGYSSITIFAALTTNSPIFKAVQCAISYIYYSEKWLSWSTHYDSPRVLLDSHNNPCHAYIREYIIFKQYKVHMYAVPCPFGRGGVWLPFSNPHPPPPIPITLPWL